MKTEIATSNERIMELDESNFERIVRGAKCPVLVQFWAGWSGLCKTMTPVLESIAGNDSIPVQVGRVNVERDGHLAENYGVQAVPTLLLFNRGGLQDRVVGSTTQHEVQEKLERFK